MGRGRKTGDRLSDEHKQNIAAARRRIEPEKSHSRNQWIYEAERMALEEWVNISQASSSTSKSQGAFDVRELMAALNHALCPNTEHEGSRCWDWSKLWASKKAPQSTSLWSMLAPDLTNGKAAPVCSFCIQWSVPVLRWRRKDLLLSWIFMRVQRVGKSREGNSKEEAALHTLHQLWDQWFDGS
jgi:hypothetical protein